MSKRLKSLIVNDLQGRLGQLSDTVVVDCSALNAAEVLDLRNTLRAGKLTVNMVKNTLARRALTQLGHQVRDEWFSGPTALVHGEVDAISSSKVLDEWRRKAKKEVKIKGGILEGQSLSAAEAERLVTMPSPQQLKAMLVSVVCAPLRDLVSIANNVLAGVPQVVQAIVDKKNPAEGA